MVLLVLLIRLLGFMLPFFDLLLTLHLQRILST